MQTVQSIAARAVADQPVCGAAPYEVHVQERFEIVTSDGERLAATLHAPVGEPKAAVQIHAGIGVKRQFYRHFASYLAAQGYAVLSFDVRGMGESLRGPLRRCKASIVDWGSKDMPAALDWLARRYPNVPRFVVGHSMGGELAGLMPNHQLLDGLVLVFSSKGNMSERPLQRWLQAVLFMGVYLHLTIPLFGYAPVRFLMTAQDLPAGAARDWSRLVFHRGWIESLAKRGAVLHYGEITAPILAFALDEDTLAPPRSCANLLREYYTGAESEFVTLRAADAPEPSQLTHLGYFRKKFAESHWSQVAAWLDRRVEELSPRQLHALTA